MIKCKLFGHNWEFYKEYAKEKYYSYYYLKDFEIDIEREFRICNRCHHKQIRLHHIGNESDWETHILNKVESRDKILKELGI